MKPTNLTSFVSLTSTLPSSYRRAALIILLVCSLGLLAGCGEQAASPEDNAVEEDNAAGETQQTQQPSEDPDQPQEQTQGSEPSNSSNEGNDGNGSSDANSDQQESQQAPEQSQQDQQLATIGDEVSVGEVSYTVTDAERVSRLEDPYGLDEPLTGNFMVLSFTFTNNSSEPVTVSDLGLYLYDGEGNRYETDSDAAFYLPDETALYMVDRVNPGLSRDVQTIYEIPPGAGDFELEVSSGFLGNDTARIDLESQESQQASDSSGEDSAPLTGSPTEIEEDVRLAVEGYYEAVNAGDWSYTYAHRDSRTQSAFTEEEWARRNGWFEDTNSTTTELVSVDLDESTLSSEQPIANVERELTIDATGYSEIRETTFVYEDGMWVVQYPEGGMPLYMPDATFEEFVRANSS
ncbi:DUF4352 domain-containing protein [Rubrobacter aplysinae]|uniref:DUF4352 domain-containing protein n=1 Tax=Rubrobacter aplysinae TaxID=909625 RepID=UPI001364A70A|nr:DUF4352 domain-containing protein [Rubrobacter aplysinae]